MEPILKVADLSKAFSRAGRDAFFAVDHVSFEVQPGEILGIVGESGSGKSTIARLITRQIDATGGQIFIDGQDITRLRGRDLIPVYAKIQMVFQSPADSFDPRRTLGDGICESLRNKGVPKAEREAKARALALAAGELRREVAHAVRETDLFEHGDGGFTAFLGADLTVKKGQFDIIEYVQRIDQMERLEDET